MARDYRKLKVFSLADELVSEVYVATRRFPPEERIGLQAQVRKAAVAVPSSIIAGCERSSESEYVHYSAVAMASASETRYLLQLASRLGYLAEESCRDLEERYSRLIGGLYKLIQAVRDRESGDGSRRTRRKDDDRAGADDGVGVGGDDRRSSDASAGRAQSGEDSRSSRRKWDR